MWNHHLKFGKLDKAWKLFLNSGYLSQSKKIFKTYCLSSRVIHNNGNPDPLLFRYFLPALWSFSAQNSFSFCRILIATVQNLEFSFGVVPGMSARARYSRHRPSGFPLSWWALLAHYVVDWNVLLNVHSRGWPKHRTTIYLLSRYVPRVQSLCRLKQVPNKVALSAKHNRAKAYLK